MNIRANDVVRVVFGSCPHNRRDIGLIATVTRVYHTACACPVCTERLPGTLCAEIVNEMGMSTKPISWLIKIDPPPLTEDAPTGEELMA